MRGPTAGEGYWNQRSKSRRTFVGEWTYTGDKFFRDADGYYHYCGRTDDMFKVSGMWVSPFEVEAALASHEAVLEAAVIGKEDADGLIKPKAFIVLRDGYAAEDRLIETLRVHVKSCAGPWKYPRWIDIRPDLPRTATGKIQRFKLRELEIVDTVGRVSRRRNAPHGPDRGRNALRYSILRAFKQPLHQPARQDAGDAAAIMAGRERRLHRHDLIAHQRIEAGEHARIERAAAKSPRCRRAAPAADWCR